MKPAGKSMITLLHRASQIADFEFLGVVGSEPGTPRQAVVMMAIAARGSASQTDIVEDTGIDRSTLSDVVRRLGNMGMVTRRRSREDGRAYAVKLTDVGEKQVKGMQKAFDEVDRLMLSRVSKKNRDVLVEALAELALYSEPRT